MILIVKFNVIYKKDCIFEFWMVSIEETLLAHVLLCHVLFHRRDGWISWTNFDISDEAAFLHTSSKEAGLSI